jgi:hypothetical protein
MFRKDTRMALTFHVPLVRLMLCLDCEECFELGVEECPGCGSETWTPVARFFARPPRKAVGVAMAGARDAA